MWKVGCPAADRSAAPPASGRGYLRKRYRQWEGRSRDTASQFSRPVADGWLPADMPLHDRRARASVWRTSFPPPEKGSGIYEFERDNWRDPRRQKAIAEKGFDSFSPRKDR